ncbi:MAG: zinc-dependent alcohol dehydrogenase family protein [Anaerolineaceae bacterium]|nr:zinc-dependent alcohol dehydrogenase family protein [Anaerolineaceae bacterium]
MKSMRLFTQKPVSESPLALVDLPKPSPGPGQVLLRVSVCGVCHTDLHTVEGDIHPPSLPVTPGHQVVARVEALGEGVDNLSPGERVGVPWLQRACGSCEYCLRGEENLCANAHFTGFHVDGGFAEYMLADASYALPLPDGISDESAAPLLCAGIIGYRSLRKADLGPGERLGLFGFGASAHLAIQVARHWGCEVYVFTRSPEHRRHAQELGAAWVGGVEEEAPELLDRAVIFAPAGYLVPIALEKLRPGGTLAINAIHMSNIPEMSYSLIYAERTLRSVANATYQDGVEFLKLAARIPIIPTTTLYPLEAANQALQELKGSLINGEAVLRIGSFPPVS